MESQTKGKIDEAQFFLLKFKENYNSEEFRYYLSAFISAARSIIWVMNSEFKNDPIFNMWYTERLPTEEEKTLFKRFNDLRITTTKQKPIETHRLISSITIQPANFIEADFIDKMCLVNISEPDKDGKQSLSFISESGKIIEGEICNYKIVNELHDDEDLYILCEKYLDSLIKIYNEWILTENSSEKSGTPRL